MITKRELIDQIRRYNASAQTDFLAGFDEDDLLAYLHQLKELERDRQRGEALELVGVG